MKYNYKKTNDKRKRENEIKKGEYDKIVWMKWIQKKNSNEQINKHYNDGNDGVSLLFDIDIEGGKKLLKM